MLLLSRYPISAPIDEIARITHQGMASWAIPDTSNRCSDCVFWGHPVRATEQPRKFRVPAPRRCTKYRALMNKGGAPVPASAKACRFFQPSSQTPAGQEASG
jgi:hypothetical protein